MQVLEILDVHASYGAHAVLRGVTLQVAPGQWFCLLGPNGVGKSTLLQCLAGRVVPRRGEIRIAGASLADRSPEAKRALGYACAPDQLPGLLTGRQCLEVYALAQAAPGRHAPGAFVPPRTSQLEAIDPAVLALAEALRFSAYLDAYVDTYSLGTRQKLCVLLALLGAPRLIVLDEAFNGLDPRSALTLKHDLQRRMQAGAAVLLATHSLDIVEHYADRAALMMDGRIVREWSEQELTDLRARGIDLESELAAAGGGDA